MRKEFVQVATRSQALQACPWAAKVIKVEGGFMCFESVDDAKTWAKQK